MEALVILLAEFLMVFVVPAIVLTVEIAAMVIGLLLGLATWLLTATSRPGTVSAAESERKETFDAKSSRVFRLITAIASVGLVLTIGGLVLVNTLFFESAIRQVVGLVARRTGTQLDFRSVSGNLFTGRFAFENVSAKRVSDTKNSFALKVDSLNGKVDLRTLLVGPISLTRLSIATVSGTFHQQEMQRTGGNAHDAGQIRPKRRFRIEDLALHDVDVTLSNGDRAPVALSLKSVTSMPFRSNFAVFDLLFRSNVAGQIDGHEISIATRSTEGGRITQWRMPDLPIASVSAFVSRPPIGWMREGTLSVSVDDRWALAKRAEIDMDWNIRMLGARAEPRAGAGVMEQTFALPIIDYINRKGGNIDLRFRFVMNENQFEDSLSLDAGVIWHAVVRSMANAIATGTDRNPDEVGHGIDTALKGFKGFLDKVRKPPANQ